MTHKFGVRSVGLGHPYMDKFVIRGGNPLLGTVRISGAKNAALPAMAAALLTEEPVILENIPQVRDIETERKLLAAMGAEVELGYGRAQHRTTICCRNLVNPEASYDLVKTMRASTLVLGPLVARMKQARVSLPGGCAIGARPIDLHLKGLEKLGANISQEHGYIEARAERLKGARIVFEKITVTGTEDLMMAATLAEGETVLENCAREPEVVDLAMLLNKMGAQIAGAGTHTIRIQGVEKLHGARHRIIPDRIEAGTLHRRGRADRRRLAGLRLRSSASRCAAAEAGGVRRASRDQWRFRPRAEQGPVEGRRRCHRRVSRLSHRHAGAVHGAGDPSRGRQHYHRKHFREPLHARPGTGAHGSQHQDRGNRAVVRGKTPLSGAAVQASDLRASASLVLAALVAEGETIIDRVYHIDRGYERIEEKLRGVGAQIRRIGEFLPKRVAAPAAAG